jgi:Kelch motif
LLLKGITSLARLVYRTICDLALTYFAELSILWDCSGLNSAEYYDPQTNEWHLVQSMSTRRSSVGVGVIAGECSPEMESFIETIDNVKFQLY